MRQQPIAAEIIPVAPRGDEAARALQVLGFRILHIGTSISVEAPASLWKSTFNVDFEPRPPPLAPRPSADYPKAITKNLQIPPSLKDLVGMVAFAEPPDFH